MDSAAVVVVVQVVNVVKGSAGNNELQIQIWPLPKDVSHGSSSNVVLSIPKDFHVSTKHDDVSGILRDAFSRLLSLIQLDHAVYPPTHFLNSSSSLLLGLNVVVSSIDQELRYGVDEWYKLSIPSPAHLGNPVYASLEAKTVYGALHGLQTFSQLCRFNVKTKTLEVHMVPWTIIDEPRFSYRGLLIDTSRHYLPLPVIKEVIDSMSYAKLNVLHWHIVDSQSFPLEIPSYPKLWNGAYSESERYTIEDAKEIIFAAMLKDEGLTYWLKSMSQDMLVHANGLNVRGIGYPSLWPSKTCQEPLDVSNEFTFKVISGILSDFRKIFKFKFVHLGGDEVNTSCWTTTPRINKWLREHGMNGSEAYEYFVLRAQNIALSYGYEIVNWEETFNNFGNRLSRKTVVHNWLGGGVAKKAVAAGLRCIVSNQDKWYLDHLDAEWQGFYSNEPLANITNPNQQKLVIGGEVCMWGEHIDASDIQQTIWPRAAAAAERLWTPYDKLAKDPKEVTGRLAHFSFTVSPAMPHHLVSSIAHRELTYSINCTYRGALPWNGWGGQPCPTQTMNQS
ncbi:hypothetical protein TIFTF001_016024 [Ficus carica]|uniref:Beta-hexosaminidase n=1 Tax=Ficus carica TaxID=3494 RepID=A0AA88D9H9_FICCA|nr:hypothetical protein TIFTF001_016024 [Ficus carica]